MLKEHNIPDVRNKRAYVKRCEVEGVMYARTRTCNIM